MNQKEELETVLEKLLASNRTSVITGEKYTRIVNFLQNPSEETDANFKFWCKQRQFSLKNLSGIGLHSVVVCPAPKRSKMANYLKPVAAILLPNVGGYLGSMVTRPETRPSQPGQITWYQALKKPSFQPPPWLFPPVWTSLYCSMGYASYMIWRDGGGFEGEAALPLACYGTSLALNWAWSPLFFKYKKLGLAFMEIMGLWGSIVATMATFYQVNPTAAYILVPYLGWVSFASFLNFYIWKNNKDRTD